VHAEALDGAAARIDLVEQRADVRRASIGRDPEQRPARVADDRAGAKRAGDLLEGLRVREHHLQEAIVSGAFDDDDDPDAEFVFGLERVLDGIDALVQARAPAA
jgi:hypothetical protein